MEKRTLLQKALAVPTHTPPDVNREEMELALAWVRGEVTNRQIQTALKGKQTGGAAVYVFLAHALKTYLITLAMYGPKR